MSTVTRRKFFETMAYGAAGALAAGALPSGLKGAGMNAAAQSKPNFIIMFADDMGYGDWNRGGNPTIRTPNMNRMADEGCQMTQFYSGNPVCSPSRSSLLTGRTVARTGVLHVFFPLSGKGMSPDEITIADALKPLGYKSACIGKWHLGSDYEYRPLRQGFDYYYGILYSNDMSNPDIYRNDEVIEHPTDQTTLTKRYTEEALKFIRENKDNPFLVYLPYTMPHIPLFASENFVDTSRRGLFGDVIEEIDWSVGQINGTLDELGLSENTLVIFTSDNGPWMIMDERGGTAGQLHGAKGDTWEGGMREPFIARWPGRIPAGTISMETGSVLDFLPTCVELAGGKIPSDRPIDGVNLMPALKGKAMPERPIFYHSHKYLNAVRLGPWKLHFRYYDHGRGGYQQQGNWITGEAPLLYNLDIDPSERWNVADKNPSVVKHLKKTAEEYLADVERRGENKDLVNWFINDWPTAPRNER